MRYAVPAVLLALIGLDSFRPIADYDVFWHLAAGRIMVEQGRVLTIDPLSWTIQGKRWVNHEWFSQVLSAYAERAGGLTGVRLLTSAVVVAGFLALWGLAARRTRSTLLAAAVVSLGFILYLFRILHRPDVWTPFFLYSTCAVLLREDLSAARKSLIAVLVAAVWVNLHAGALVTPLLLGAFAVGSWPRSRRDAGVFAAAAAACALAVCATPNGWHVWEFAFHARRQTQLVPEWQSLWSFPGTEYLREKQFFVWIVVAWVVALLYARRELDLRETLVALLGIAMAASAIRLLFFLVLPFLQFARVFAEHPWRKPFAALLVTACAWLAFEDFTERLPTYEEARLSPFSDVFYPHYPEKAVDFLSRVHLQGHAFVHPGWAGYLSWRVPRDLIFVDGRTPDFGDRLCEDAMHMLCLPVEGESPLDEADRELLRDRLLDQYEIAWVLVPTPYFDEDTPERLAKWRRAYADELASVYIRLGRPESEANLLECSGHGEH